MVRGHMQCTHMGTGFREQRGEGEYISTMGWYADHRGPAFSESRSSPVAQAWRKT